MKLATKLVIAGGGGYAIGDLAGGEISVLVAVMCLLWGFMSSLAVDHLWK